jgi:CPA1 family monovalent cation:H+ antiporter
VEQVLMLGTIGIVVVVVVNTLAPRFGVAAPLMLVLVGIGISLLPFVEPIEIEPEVVLAGMLPLLLYSAAVNTPIMEFRRDLPTISIFAVLLVVASAVGVGFLVVWMVPDIPLGIGIALGAIVSPTDAVATTIVRKSGASQRIVMVLEGEALFNDASALVLLRSAVAAVTASFSFWEITVDFLFAVGVALAIGFAVGYLNLAVRRRIPHVASNVAFSVIVPFLAFLPAEHLGASGLVAAVVAGLVTGEHTAQHLPSEVRIAERAVWHTIELVLESAIFLLMGLQLFSLHEDAVLSHQNEWMALELGGVAVLAVLAFRTLFVSGSVWLLARRTKRMSRRQQRLNMLRDRLDDDELNLLLESRIGPRLQGRDGDTTKSVGRVKQMLKRREADLDYLASEQFGWKDGVVLVAAGMRGAITLAAAQSLPADTPHRSMLILTAFVVAAGTLLLQGGTLTPVVKALKLPQRDPGADFELGRTLDERLSQAALEGLESGSWRRPNGTEFSRQSVTAARRMVKAAIRIEESSSDDTIESSELRLEIIDTERAELLRIRDLGTFPSNMLENRLLELDAEQFGIELKLR